MEQGFPGYIIGEVSQAAATLFFGYAHLIETGVSGRRAYLTNEFPYVRTEAAIRLIATPWIIQQFLMLSMTRFDFLLGKRQ